MEIVSQQSLHGIILNSDYFVRRRLFPARRMPKTLRSPEQLQFLELLRRARKDADLTQQALATKLRRPQSFVAKYENGERRIDVIEFAALARALDVAPVTLLRQFVAATGSGMETPHKDHSISKEK
jgi:ribosome-binding protein aMBF1 (putative translation factor)